jgi:hypothetical protein
MPPMKRELIDTGIFDYFTEVALDIEATRKQLAEARDRKLAEIRALTDEANQEALRARGRLERVRRDYQDEKLTAEDWSEQREQLADELAAAEANVERMRDQEAEVGSWGELADVEQETLTRLADLRESIAGQVTDAESLAALRATLMRLFERFTVYSLDRTPPDDVDRRILERDETPTHERVPVITVPEPKDDPVCIHSPEWSYAGKYAIEVWIREQALGDGFILGYHPTIHREPLQQAANNARMAFTR